MRLWTIMAGELERMYRQKGTYAGYALLAFLIAMFMWGIWAEGPSSGDVNRRFGAEMAVGGNLVSGGLVPYLLLEIPVAINVFIPLLISMIAGGLVAGEAQRGALRTVLIRPVHRWAVVLGKLVAAFVHAGSLVLFLGLTSLVAGYILFGGGDIITVEQGLRIFEERNGLLRLAAGYGLTMVTLFSVAAIALLCSTVFERSLTAAGVTVGFLIVSGALMAIPYFEWLQPYLLTSHFHSFRHVFVRPVDWPAIWTDLGYVGAYTGVAIAATLAVFCRRDMTC
ncbi:MAG: ABC transporter permease subunit [Armatimonadetes bacterium]|jgi:ABC-2 type transport system permease protein|nr:ABC transporter permease subunit [Armatimonadota bacterium]